MHLSVLQILQSHSLSNRPGRGVATGCAVVQARAATTCGWFRMPQSARCSWRAQPRWAWSTWWEVTQRRRWCERRSRWCSLRVSLARPRSSWYAPTPHVLSVHVEVLHEAAHGVAGVQLSGVGPAETLEEFGIPLLADLPVGQDAHVRLCSASVCPSVHMITWCCTIAHPHSTRRSSCSCC